MAVKATFVADFASFDAAVKNAEIELKSFESNANKVGSALNKMADSLQGTKVIQNAQLMAAAVEKIGGVSQLTATQLQQLGPQAAAAIELMRARAITVPPELQKIADSTKVTTNSWQDFVSGFKVKDAVTDPLGAAKGAAIGFGESIGAIGIAAVGAIGAVVAVSAAIFELAERSAAVGGHLNDMSETTGITVPALSRLSKAAQVAGTDIGSVSNVIFMMQKNMGESPDKFAKGLERIGLSFDDFKRLQPEQQILALSAQLKATADPVERNAAGFEMMGRQFRDIAPALMKLNEAMERTAGITPWTDEEARAAEEFEMQVTALKVEFAEVSIALGRDLIPAMTALLGLVRPLAGFAKDVVVEWSGIAPLFRLVGDAWRTAADALDLLRGKSAEIPKIKGLEDLSAQVKKLKDDTFDAARTPEALRDAWLKASLDQALKPATMASLELEHAEKRLTESAAESARAHLKAGETAKKFKDELEKNADAAHKVEAGFFGLHTSVGVVDDSVLKFGQSSAKLDDEMNKLEETAHIANFGFKGMADGLEHVGERVRELGPDIAHQFVGPIQEASKVAISFGDTLKSALGGALSGLNGIFQSAFEGGGGIAGAVKSFATKMTSSLLGTIPVIGSFLSQFSGAFVAGISKLFGGVSEAEKKARVDIQNFEKQLASSLTATQKAEAGNKGWAMTTIAVRDAYIATGRSAAQAEAAVQQLWASSKQGADASKAAMDAINAVLNEQKQDAADLEAAVQRYGFSIEELGPAMQRQKLDEQAQQLLNDWRLLVGAGIDISTVNEKMAASVQDYLTLAQKTGMEVPVAMKPILQSMIDQGTLVDENGNLITDLGQIGVEFSETMTQGFDRIVEKLQELLQQLGKVPDAINNIPQPNPIHIPIVYDDPGFDQRSQNTYAAMGGLVTSHGIEPQYFGMGGRVLPFRPRGTDTVPAMLTPGERVLTRAQNAAYERGGMSMNEVVDELRGLRSENQQLRHDLARLLPKAIRDAIILAS